MCHSFKDILKLYMLFIFKTVLHSNQCILFWRCVLGSCKPYIFFRIFLPKKNFLMTPCRELCILCKSFIKPNVKKKRFCFSLEEMCKSKWKRRIYYDLFMIIIDFWLKTVNRFTKKSTNIMKQLFLCLHQYPRQC